MTPLGSGEISKGQIPEALGLFEKPLSGFSQFGEAAEVQAGTVAEIQRGPEGVQASLEKEAEKFPIDLPFIGPSSFRTQSIETAQLKLAEAEALKESELVSIFTPLDSLAFGEISSSFIEQKEPTTIGEITSAFVKGPRLDFKEGIIDKRLRLASEAARKSQERFEEKGFVFETSVDGKGKPSGIFGELVSEREAAVERLEFQTSKIDFLGKRLKERQKEPRFIFESAAGIGAAFAAGSVFTGGIATATPLIVGGTTTASILASEAFGQLSETFIEPVIEPIFPEPVVLFKGIKIGDDTFTDIGFVPTKVPTAIARVGGLLGTPFVIQKGAKALFAAERAVGEKFFTFGTSLKEYDLTAKINQVDVPVLNLGGTGKFRIISKLTEPVKGPLKGVKTIFLKRLFPKETFIDEQINLFAEFSQKQGFDVGKGLGSRELQVSLPSGEQLVQAEARKAFFGTGLPFKQSRFLQEFALPKEIRVFGTVGGEKVLSSAFEFPKGELFVSQRTFPEFGTFFDTSKISGIGTTDFLGGKGFTLGEFFTPPKGLLTGNITTRTVLKGFTSKGGRAVFSVKAKVPLFETGFKVPPVSDFKPDPKAFSFTKSFLDDLAELNRDIGGGLKSFTGTAFAPPPSKPIVLFDSSKPLFVGGETAPLLQIASEKAFKQFLKSSPSLFEPSLAGSIVFGAAKTFERTKP